MCVQPFLYWTVTLEEAEADQWREGLRQERVNVWWQWRKRVWSEWVSVLQLGGVKSGQGKEGCGGRFWLHCGGETCVGRCEPLGVEVVMVEVGEDEFVAEWREKTECKECFGESDSEGEDGWVSFGGRDSDGEGGCERLDAQ